MRPRTGPSPSQTNIIPCPPSPPLQQPHISPIAPSQRPHAGRRSQRTRLYQSLPFFTRFRTDRGRQHRSHANWLSWPHAQPVIDKDDVLAAAPPLYLPMHQQDIIYTILYCVCDISNNVHECTRCLAITVCRFTTRSALGATMRCVHPSHWFVLSLTLKYRPFTGRRISLQLRKP